MMTHQTKTVLLLTAISGLFLWIGHMAGGSAGMTYALIMAVLMNAGAYWFSDKLVLAMHQAQPIGPDHPSGVYEMVKELSVKAQLPMPSVYLTPQRIPNAFATGRNPHHAAVAVTQGIVSILTPRELRAVLAHELGHIRNRDILISTLAAALASAVMYLTHMLQWFGLAGHHRDSEHQRGIHPLGILLTVILAPLAAGLIQAAVSRTREFMADQAGAEISEDPEALASALQTISDPQLLETLRQHGAAEETAPEMAHLYIMNPFSGESLMRLFSTHPPVQERIRKLEAFTDHIQTS